MAEDEKTGFSIHILYASANLIGFCFVVLGFIKASGHGDLTLIDEISALAVIVFLIATFFSYASLRKTARSLRYERIADIFFIGGLVLLAIMAVALCFKLVY
jgi:hypothetical protein